MSGEMKTLMDTFWHLPSAILGAAGVKGWEWALKKWKLRSLSDLEKGILVASLNTTGFIRAEVHEMTRVTLYFAASGQPQIPNVEGELDHLLEVGLIFVTSMNLYRLTPTGWRAAKGYKAKLVKQGALQDARFYLPPGWMP